MFVKFLYFVIFTGLGVATLKYRKRVYEWTGRWYWAEKYLGNGGTVVVITLSGIGMIFFWVGYPFGAFDDFKNGSDRFASPTHSSSQAAPSDSAKTSE